MPAVQAAVNSIGPRPACGTPHRGDPKTAAGLPHAEHPPAPAPRRAAPEPLVSAATAALPVHPFTWTAGSSESPEDRARHRASVC